MSLSFVMLKDHVMQDKFDILVDYLLTVSKIAQYFTQSHGHHINVHVRFTLLVLLKPSLPAKALNSVKCLLTYTA